VEDNKLPRSVQKSKFPRDRIFSLLALVVGGQNLHVSYQEACGDLFWRAGLHFDAWAKVRYIVELRDLLQLQTVDILRHTIDLKSRSLSILVEHLPVTAQYTSRYPEHSCKIEYTCPYGAIAVLGAEYAGAEFGAGSDSIRVAVHERGDEVAVTIKSGYQTAWYNVTLDDLLYPSGDERVPVMSLKTLEKRLGDGHPKTRTGRVPIVRTRDLKEMPDDGHVKRWMLRVPTGCVPTGYVLHCLDAYDEDFTRVRSAFGSNNDEEG
jgi:hypothetical protein